MIHSGPFIKYLVKKRNSDWRTTGERPVLSLQLQPGTADATVLWLSPSFGTCLSPPEEAMKPEKRGRAQTFAPDWSAAPRKRPSYAPGCVEGINDLPFGPQPHSLPTALNNDSHFKNLAIWTVMTILPFWTANVSLENSWFGDVGQWSMPQLDLS